MDLFGKIFLFFLINSSFMGLHYQGFECVQCALVTHKKCYQHIPFWCQKAKYPVCIINYLCIKTSSLFNLIRNLYQMSI